MNVGLADAWTSLPTEILSTVKFGSGGMMVLGCFSWSGPLSSSEGKVYATSYKDILGNIYSFNTVPTVSPPAWQCPCTQSRVHKETVWWIWCGGTWGTPVNTFGMDWKVICEPGLPMQPSHVSLLIQVTVQLANPFVSAQNLAAQELQLIFTKHQNGGK